MMLPMVRSMTKVTHGSIDGLLSARWEARIPSTARGHDVVKTAAMESTALLLKRMLWDM